MAPELHKEIASKGGKAAHAKGTGRKCTPEQASIMGKIGGAKTSSNKEHMRAIGRLGGLAWAEKRKGLKDGGN